MIDYAFRELALYDENFSGLDAKANGILQFVAIILGLSALQVGVGERLSTLRMISLGIFGLVLLFALLAWWVRGGEGIPPTDSVCARLKDKDFDATKEELLGCLTRSTDRTKRLCSAKFWYLQIAFGGLLLGVVGLLVSIYTGW